VRVGFAGGRPWTFLPEITDYLETTDTTRVRVGLGLDIRQGIASRPFQDADGLSPPWLKPWDGTGTPRHVAPTNNELQRNLSLPPVPAAGSELLRRYELVPWAVPPHPEHEAALSTEWLTGIGLEWRGLRVGYGKALEGEFPPVAPSSWWARLREVSASPVALRGDHEAFLFYDGSMKIPSPVGVGWKDATQREVVLVARTVNDLRGPRPVLEERSTFEIKPGPVPLVLVLRKEAGQEAVGVVHRRLDPARGPVTVSLDRLPLKAAELRRVLREALEAEGLNAAEAGALLSTFEGDFFGKDGVRAITLVQRAVYDRALPITILPVPDRLVRAGFVLKELGMPFEK
jgi:hypothetical protein